MAYAFHQAAVAGENISTMIYQIIAIAGGHMAFNHRHTNRIGNALTKRSGGGFNALSMAKFWMARSACAQLPEIAKLIDEGFRPRVVVSHAGNGLGLFIKDLLPEALHVGYFEWYFRPSTTKNLLANFDLNDQLKTGLRNLPILQELERCDLGVVPTEWQKKQFPN